MITPALMFTPGPMELGLILVLLLFCFGAGKLPQVGKALGQTLGELTKAIRGAEEVEADLIEAKRDVERQLRG